MRYRDLCMQQILQNFSHFKFLYYFRMSKSKLYLIEFRYLREVKIEISIIMLNFLVIFNLSCCIICIYLILVRLYILKIILILRSFNLLLAFKFFIAVISCLVLRQYWRIWYNSFWRYLWIFIFIVVFRHILIAC